METTEFSELLKTLLDDVHSRVVEQYSKAEAVRGGSSVALGSLSENETLPIWQQTSPVGERVTHKYACTRVLSTPVPVVSHDVGRCFTVPDVPEDLAPRLLTRPGTLMIDIMMGRYGKWVISPESTTLQYWLFVNVLAMAYVAFVNPVQAALMDTARMDAMFVVNCIVDSVFIVDIILQFFMTYYVKTDYGNRLEHRHSMIVWHYLKTWFILDFISSFPFDLLACTIQEDNVTKAKGVKVVRLLRLLKMTRMVKASRIFRRLEVSLMVTNTNQVFDIHKFILYLILITHWLTCLWVLTLSLGPDDSARWVDSLEESEKDHPWKLYIAALYFTAYTMTSVGYGDITPVSVVERIVCILIIFICGLMGAFVIGEVTSSVGNLDKEEQDFRSLMDNLNCMMRDRGLPTPVKRRLKTFFLSARHAQRTEQQEQLLGRLSPVLQGEVALVSNWNSVKQVKFIYNLVPEARGADVTRAPHFVVDFALALRSVVLAQSEVFGEPRVLYILKKGLALSRARSLMKVFHAGDVWGEDFVLSKSSIREPEARLAMTYAELFQLTFANFRTVCQRHSSSRKLHKRLRRFVVRLSARRAILLEARLRQFAEVMPGMDQEGSTEIIL